MLNIFPDEVLELILLELPYKDILKICGIVPYINNLCNKSNILEKRKMKGYPRIDGHCKSYDVLHLIDSTLYKSTFLSGYKIDLDNILNDILDKLDDIVRGDLLCCYGLNVHNEGVCIFDGSKFINLDINVDCYGNLPSQFLINDTSPYYWKPISKNVKRGLDEVIKIGIENNYYCWLDTHHHDLLKYLIYDNKINKFKTNFKSNNINYTIIFYFSDLFDYSSEELDEYRNDVEVILSKTKLLLEYDSRRHTCEKNTLLLSMLINNNLV